jgi:hypothetical protein
MAFKISADLGCTKPDLQIARSTEKSAQHIEAIIDDERIGREQASRILRMMADRLLECRWPPDRTGESRASGV